MANTAAIGIGVFFLIILIAGGLFYYSYSQISVDLNDVSYHSIDWTNFTFSTMLKLGLNALSGNWLSAAFDLIDGVNLNLFFGMTNNGFLPVHIPDLSYNLSVNGVHVGNGKSTINMTINPGESKQIKAFQNFKKSSLTPAISSIVSNSGVMDLRVKGTAYFNLLGLQIPIPFESSKQISIYDEIKNKLLGEASKNQKAQTSLSLSISKYSVDEGESITLSGKLSTNGQGLSNALIYIKDEDSGSGDDDIGSITTDSQGRFDATWNAYAMDPFDSTIELYAVFEGSQNYDSARSRQYNVSIQEQSLESMFDEIKSNLETSQSSGSQYTAPKYTPPENTFKSTSLSFTVSDYVVNSGDVIYLSGKLIDSSGRALQNGSIYIKDEDTGSGDDDIVILQTNSNGEFSYNWYAKKMDPFDRVVELYAVFEGTTNFGYSRSAQIDIRVN